MAVVTLLAHGHEVGIIIVGRVMIEVSDGQMYSNHLLTSIPRPTQHKFITVNKITMAIPVTLPPLTHSATFAFVPRPTQYIRPYTVLPVFRVIL